ncbi:MAG: SlyX family protein [Kangiellaceae bacterium]|nr:SlyX family protein [Kangiellaceae bacterium]
MSNQSESQSQNNRLEELETKLTFQDHLIDELNQALIVQQRDITKLTNLLESVISQVEKLGDSGNQGDQVELPPHY